MTFDAQGDMCLGFFKEVYEEAMPYTPINGRVLELGCAEADWLKGMRLARPDLHLTGIDARHVHRDKADVLIRGDFLQHDFDPSSFDAIVAVSVVEWCGIGHYIDDPVDPDGDKQMMQRARQWIKPGGWMYLDTPCALDDQDPKGFVFRNSLRAYTEKGLKERVYQGLWREARRWRFDGNGHPDGPYLAVILVPV